MNTYLLVSGIILAIVATAILIQRKKQGSIVAASDSSMHESENEKMLANNGNSEPPMRGIYPVASRSSYSSSLVSNSNKICNLPLTRKIYANVVDTAPKGGVQFYNEPELITPFRGGGWLCIMWNQKVKMYGYVNVDGKVSTKYPFKNC
jgi:hypothetical protein